MRARVRTGSRPEVTIWILEPWRKVSIRLLAASSDRRARRGGQGRDGGKGAGSFAAGGRGAGRATVARGAGRAAWAARLGVSSVLGGEALALDVAPKLLGHLGGSDRRGAEQRLQAVRATPEADCVASECGLLAGDALRHLLPLRWKLSHFHPMTTTCGGPGQRKRRRLGAVRGWTSPGSCRRVGRGRARRDGLRRKERADHRLRAGARGRPCPLGRIRACRR